VQLPTGTIIVDAEKTNKKIKRKEKIKHD